MRRCTVTTPSTAGKKNRFILYISTRGCIINSMRVFARGRRVWVGRFDLSGGGEHQCVEPRIAIFHRWYTNSIHPISKVHLSKGTHTIDDILMCDIE